jgi:hypothetical protein
MIVLLLNPEIPIYQKVIVMDSTMCDRVRLIQHCRWFM